MKFPVNIEPDEEFFLVTFPDIPEAITQGEDVDDALRHAADALETDSRSRVTNRSARPERERSIRDGTLGPSKSRSASLSAGMPLSSGACSRWRWAR